MNSTSQQINMSDAQYVAWIIAACVNAYVWGIAAGFIWGAL